MEPDSPERCTAKGQGATTTSCNKGNVFLGKAVTELTVQPWKSYSRDRDLSDSGSVQKSTGQGPEPAEVPGKFGLHRAVDRSRRPPEAHCNLCCSGGHCVTRAPEQPPKATMPRKTKNAGDCREAPVDSGMVLKCVEIPLRKAALWGYELWYPWHAWEPGHRVH